jgi:EmrB/QacA subfamily drug resistance transporter
MTERQKKLAVLACLLTIVLAILDQNIVSAATVKIVRDLDPVHGLELLPWLVTAYGLAATAALPLYGKLCDVYGAKRIFVAAIAVFLAGSALCGIAQTMAELIAFRAVQGIGGGGLMSITMVVIAQMADAKKRAGQSGMAGLVAGLGLVIGPLVGGLLADSASWRWIFYVNLPLGAVALTIAATALHLPVHGQRHRIDFLGAGLVAAAASVLLLITEWGGRTYPWSSLRILGLIGLGVVLIVLFVWRQATASEPILPLGLFRNATLRIAIPVQALIGVAMMGSIVYVMVYLQVVRGIPATRAGLYLIPMAAGMTVAGLLAARLMARDWPVKWFVVAGSACAAIGTLLLSTVGVATASWPIWLALLVFGAGLGQLLGQLIIVSQQAVAPRLLGVTTTAVRFGQTLGGALGAAVFGTVLTRVYSAKAPGGLALDAVPASLRPQALHAFVSAIDVVFLGAAGVALLMLLLALRLRVVDAVAEPVDPSAAVDRGVSSAAPAAR